MTDRFRSITLGGPTPFEGKWYRADDVDAYLSDTIAAERTPDREQRSGAIVLKLSPRHAQALYDHTGTMPWAPESWSNEIRSALSERLAARAGLSS